MGLWLFFYLTKGTLWVYFLRAIFFYFEQKIKWNSFLNAKGGVWVKLGHNHGFWFQSTPLQLPDDTHFQVPFSLPLSLFHSHTDPHTHIHTHKHRSAHTNMLHSHQLGMHSLTLSFTHTNTHTHPHMHTNAHTHSLSHTLFSSFFVPKLLHQNIVGKINIAGNINMSAR